MLPTARGYGYSTPLPYDFPGFVLSEQSGTSFVAPQVAAGAALVKAAHPGFSVEQVERALLDSARKPADFVDVRGGGDNGDEADGKDDAGRYSCGALDAAAAVMWSPQASGGGSGGIGPSYTAGGSAWDVFAGAGEG